MLNYQRDPIMDTNERLDSLDAAKPFKWQLILVRQGKSDAEWTTLMEASATYQRLFEADGVEKRLLKEKQNTSNNKDN